LRYLAHKGTNTDFRDDDAIASHDFALRSKLVHQWRSVYHKIGGLTLLKTVRDSACISVGDRYLVSRGFFKIWYQCVNCRMQSHGA
jgi:hypothetical protein